MFRKVTIALLATAALAMLAPDAVSARGGGGGGMHGGGGFGGIHGGFGGGVFHGGGGVRGGPHDFSRGGSHDARFNNGRFRSAAIYGRIPGRIPCWPDRRSQPHGGAHDGQKWAENQDAVSLIRL